MNTFLGKFLITLMLIVIALVLLPIAIFNGIFSGILTFVTKASKAIIDYWNNE